MSDPVTTCSNCGNAILTSGPFCANCGHAIEVPTEQASEAPEAASIFQTNDNISSDASESAGDSTAETALQSEQSQPEEPSTPEVPTDRSSSFIPASQSAGIEQSTAYAPSPPSSEWQPGAYDMGATQPVEIPASSQAPPLPPYEATPGQPQSIFSPPPPVQGLYTQPMSPQQGYSPPPQQTFTPPPAYSNQGLQPTGTQPLQPGQPYPTYQQSQPGYPQPQQATATKDPTTALMLELLGYLGFLGIGHIYAGKTNRGIALLIGWLLYLTASFVLTFCLVGCFMFLAWLIVPPLSGLWVKNEMEKERITGFRQ